MYSRYKSKKRDNLFLKILAILVLVIGSGYLIYTYRSYIFFWKYTFNKLEAKIAEASRIKDREQRKNLLLELNKLFKDSKDENITSADSFLRAGKVHFLLGETYLKSSFSDMVINDTLKDTPPEAHAEFASAIKDVRKGLALYGYNDMQEYFILLAKASFYTGYYPIEEIAKLTASIDSPEKMGGIETVRFIGVTGILNGKEDAGLELIKKYGHVGDTLEGQLFLATAYKLAKRYTNAIMEYKQVLAKTKDNSIMKLAQINLGKIYFIQSLYSESLAQFNNALKIDERDMMLKIWIGKSYSAMGDETKAKAVWTEVLTSDRSNEEVKKLLGVM